MGWLKTRRNTLGHGFLDEFWWYNLLQLGRSYRLRLGRRHRLRLLHSLRRHRLWLRGRKRFFHDWWRWLYEHFRRNQIGWRLRQPERATDHE
jgi:hypothetical protein